MKTQQPGMRGAPWTAYRVWKALGSLADDLPEAAAERAEAAVADGVADLGDGEVGRAQQVLGALDPPLADVGDGGEPVDPRERAEEVELAQPGDGRELRRGRAPRRSCGRCGRAPGAGARARPRGPAARSRSPAQRMPGAGLTPERDPSPGKRSAGERSPSVMSARKVGRPRSAGQASFATRIRTVSPSPTVGLARPVAERQGVERSARSRTGSRASPRR